MRTPADKTVTSATDRTPRRPNVGRPQAETAAEDDLVSGPDDIDSSGAAATNEGYAETGLRSANHHDRIGLCGRVSVEVSGRRLDGEFSGDRARLCLAYLVLNRARPVRRDELITAVWPEHLPENPEAALATLLSRLRHALGPDAIEGRADVRLVLTNDLRIDVEEAIEAVGRADERLAGGDLIGASIAATAALECAERELLPGLEGDWIAEHRQALVDARLRALECRAEAALRLGGPALATAERAARDLISISPYRESAHRLLMRGLAARGDEPEALAAYEALRKLLRDELGATPSAETVELHKRLLEGEVDDSLRQGTGARSLSGTLTIVVAELIETDRLADRLDEEAAAAVRVTGLQLMRDAARTSEGKELQVRGDGLVLAFDSVLKALSCVTLIQQFLAHHARLNPRRALAARSGVSVGEVPSEGDALLGDAVAAARELCRRASQDQVLVSDLVASLARLTGNHEFVEIQPRDPHEHPEGPGVHELRWRSAARGGGEAIAGGDPGGSATTPLDAAEVAELKRILQLTGIDAPLEGRYSIVFAYPGQGVGDLHLELSGCTTQVCAILEETTTFEQHGVHVIGLSTEPSVPPAGCAEITFPVGILPQDVLGGILPAVERGDRRYAARTSFVVFPDGAGMRITEVSDVIAHVRKSFDVAIGRRLNAYRDAAFAHLARGSSLPSSVGVRELLSPGADSVGIPRVEVKLDLVSKLAAPDVIASEAGYIDRINRLFEEHGLERLFPAVLSICTDEEPAWYLMEAVNPVPLDRLIFEDDARTVLRTDRRELLAGLLERVATLYELTLRREIPRVARYHYLGRFVDIPGREDAQATFASLVGGELESLLVRRVVLDGSFTCHSFREQIEFLEGNVEALLEPVGAYVHGDLHLPNMVLDETGEKVVLIDPRVVWDGNDVGDPGFCDPVYDLATLLHSLHAMSAILRAIETGRTETLLEMEDSAPTEALVVQPGVLHLHENPMLEWFTGWVEHAIPPSVLGTSWRARLHIGAANAFLGWLKYARAIQTGDAWLATYAAVVYHLECGRRELERQREGVAG